MDEKSPVVSEGEIMKKIIIVGIIIGMVLSLGVYKGTKETSTDKFCSICHSMSPMVETYSADIHGGNSASGIKTKCVSCHLPHENLASYFYTKIRNGIVEFTITATGQADSVDWYEKREHRENFVYDSGCLSCHTNILQKTVAKNPKQIQMHQHYQSKLSTKNPIKCVSCHIGVGHEGLRSKLNEVKPEYTPIMNVIN